MSVGQKSRKAKPRPDTSDHQRGGEEGVSLRRGTDAASLKRAFSRIGNREIKRQLTNSARIGAITTRVNVPPIILLADQIGPDVLLENRAAWIEFYLYNMSGNDLTNVFVRATIQPTHSLNSYPGFYEVNIARLVNEDVINSAISFVLPRADLGNTVTLELCKYGDVPPGVEFPPVEVLASAQLKFDVGARFSISMGNIFIGAIASRHNDTIYVALSGNSE